MIQSKIPVKYYFEAGRAAPISWSRPIGSHQDKGEFQQLIKDL